MLTDSDRERYRKAALALEGHVDYQDMDGDIQMVARRAWNMCRELKAGGLVYLIKSCDNRAARLLRECVAKSEPLP